LKLLSVIIITYRSSFSHSRLLVFAVFLPPIFVASTIIFLHIPSKKSKERSEAPLTPMLPNLIIAAIPVLSAKWLSQFQ